MNKSLQFTLIAVGIVALALLSAWVGIRFFSPWGMMGSVGYGPGMMGGYGTGPGMMGGYDSSGLTDAAPLSVDQVRGAVERYLAAIGNDDLGLEEIMIFDNHAYAIVVEESTGIGAFELLIDPVTLAVYPEHGPNMMWNLKYGMMSGYGGGMGPGMMGRGYRYDSRVPDVSAEMPVSADEALQAAQGYLDANLAGVVVSDEITAFYGYYTIDLERDGQIIGMLSVNGFTGQVFLHTWHGDFIMMSEE